VAAQTAAVLIV